MRTLVLLAFRLTRMPGAILNDLRKRNPTTGPHPEVEDQMKTEESSLGEGGLPEGKGKPKALHQ